MSLGQLYPRCRRCAQDPLACAKDPWGVAHEVWTSVLVLVGIIDVGGKTEADPVRIQDAVGIWEPIVHPRARGFLTKEQQLHQLLDKIAEHVDKPIQILNSSQPSSADCVEWRGPVGEGAFAGSPVIRWVKPMQQLESSTFVTRLLVFLFADDEFFTEVVDSPKEPMEMRCGNRNCVNANHIAGFKACRTNELLGS